MPVFVAEFISQIKNIWAQLSGGQRLTVGAILLATVVGFGALVWVGTRPDYVAFGNQYQGAERSQLVAALEESRIDYRIENQVLQVNSAQESDARKALIRKGLGAGANAERRARRGPLAGPRASALVLAAQACSPRRAADSPAQRRAHGERQPQ